jgi:hypothetical protein
MQPTIPPRSRNAMRVASKARGRLHLSSGPRGQGHGVRQADFVTSKLEILHLATCGVLRRRWRPGRRSRR